MALELPFNFHRSRSIISSEMAETNSKMSPPIQILFIFPQNLPESGSSSSEILDGTQTLFSGHC
jgi:hypothetical protein